MQRIIAACLTIVLATPAFAGGVYTYSTDTPVSAGSTDTVVFTRNVAGNAVSDGNAIHWRAEATGDATLRFVVNGVDILDTVDVYGWDNVYEVEVWRNGTNTAHVRLWSCDETGTPLLAHEIVGVNGLAWTSQQTFQIIANGGVGGMYLTRAGLKW